MHWLRHGAVCIRTAIRFVYPIDLRMASVSRRLIFSSSYYAACLDCIPFGSRDPVEPVNGLHMRSGVAHRVVWFWKLWYYVPGA